MSELALVESARGGDHAAFEKLTRAALPTLRGLIRRLVGHPDDTDDLVQDTLLKCFTALDSFRGDSAFGTWLCAIGTRTALDFLRSRKRWRVQAQIIYAQACLASEALQVEIGGAVAAPEFSYDAREHIAYCFTCVGRSLPPEEFAALVLRDLLDLSNDEAAEALGLSTSVLRHHLSAARTGMQQSFEGLCSLVNKDGVCYQCKGLRDFMPAGKRGPQIPAIPDFDARIAIVRRADLDRGVSRAMHDVFYRRTALLEETGQGDPNARTDCGQP